MTAASGQRMVTPSEPATSTPLTAGEDTAIAALLRCAVREIAGPQNRIRAADDGSTCVVLGGAEIRARFTGGIALTLRGRPEIRTQSRWCPLGLERLIELVEQDLPDGNSEFGAQVRAGRHALDRLPASNTGTDVPGIDLVGTDAPGIGPVASWLRSEQSLATGHPFHPSPKAHLAGAGWRYAPERRTRFGLRLFAAPVEVTVDHGDAGSLDRLGDVPAGHVALPVHPWQAATLGLDNDSRPTALTDLGTTVVEAIPTSSLRTVYVPALRCCLKLSLHVRITNCVRKNAWYELAGAVELTRRLGPIAADLARVFPGTRILREPGARTARLGRPWEEGLGVIVREDPVGAAGPGVTPVVAAAIAQPGGPFSARVLAGADIDRWWDAYLQAVALPVLYAHARHGVAFEAHVQNVLVGIDPDGRPRQVILRDLEGTKLVAERHDLVTLHPRVAESLAYSPAAAWRRVVYCLVVNHLAHVAAALADHDDDALARLWRHASAVVVEQPWADGAIAALGTAPTLPAKANLGVRWARAADRDAGYVAVPNPLCRRTGVRR